MKFPDFPACEACGFKLWNPIIELDHTFVSLYDDGRFPGRCLVSLQLHMEDFDEMGSPGRALFMDEVARVGAAIKKVTGAPRINYAILGNAVPHIHAHVFPRQFERDPVPNSAPWSHPKKVYPLKPASKKKIIKDLLRALL